jgi:hypothetical protein
MAKAAFAHFEGQLGSSVIRHHSLDLDFLDTHSEDLSELEMVFTEDEIWELIRRLPVGKAPEPGSRLNSCTSVGEWSNMTSWQPSTSFSRCVGACSRVLTRL